MEICKRPNVCTYVQGCEEIVVFFLDESKRGQPVIIDHYGTSDILKRLGRTAIWKREGQDELTFCGSHFPWNYVRQKSVGLCFRLLGFRWSIAIVEIVVGCWGGF